MIDYDHYNISEIKGIIYLCFERKLNMIIFVILLVVDYIFRLSF